MKTRKIISIVLSVVTAASMVVGSMPLSQMTLVSAAGKAALSTSKMTLAVGGKKTLKLKNNKKKTTWRITTGKKYIRLKNKTKNSVKIAGIKAGTAKVQVKAGKMKYACKVIVKAEANPNASEQATLAPQLIVPVPNAPVVPVNPPVTEQPNLAVTQTPQSTEGMATEAPIESMQPADEIPTKIPLTSEKPVATKIPLVPETEKPAVTKIPLGSETELPAVTKTPQESESETPSVTQTPSETEKPEVTPSATTEPEKVQYEKHLGEKVDSIEEYYDDKDYSSVYNKDDYDNYIELTDVTFDNLEVDNVTITKSKKVWVSCGNHLIKDIGDSFSCYFQQKNVKYSIFYNDESYYSGMGGDSIGYYKIQAMYEAENGNTYFKNYYLMKQVHEFVTFDCTLNGIHIDPKDIMADGLNYFTDIYGISYKMFEIGKEYSLYAPFDLFDAGDNVEIESYTAQTIDKKSISYNENVTILEKSEADVAALRQMIEMLKEKGISVDKNINSREHYGWNKGRLSKINWENIKLSGKLSFSLFDGLTELNVSQNKLTGLDVSENSELIMLNCSSNKLENLDLTKNQKLKFGYCRNNNLKNLELAQNKELEILDCYQNVLENLDISYNLMLKELDCEYNQLKQLDVSMNKELKHLHCGMNQLVLLNISTNTKLECLDCHWNQLTTLDVSRNTHLAYLECNGNQLTSLDVSQNTNLVCLLCHNNQLTSLDVRNHIHLKKISCENNRLNNLNLENCNELRGVYCHYNQLDHLDVTSNTSLHELWCHENQLTELDVSKCPIVVLRCNDNNLTMLDLSNNIDLLYLYCEKNQLNNLDVSNNPIIRGVYCSENQLESIDVENNIALEILYCDGNQLKNLDVSKNIQLHILGCRDNQLKDLDVSHCIPLFSLDCGENQLTNLDVSNNEDLLELKCHSNQLTNLDIKNNKTLKVLDCDDNQIISFNIENNIKMIAMKYDANVVVEGIDGRTFEDAHTFVL